LANGYSRLIATATVFKRPTKNFLDFTFADVMLVNVRFTALSVDVKP
jgi:hypothetical protein